MAFFISRSKDRKRVRVHDEACLHCDEGQSLAARATGTPGPEWEGPFPTAEEARAFMEQRYPGINDRGLCQVCKPGLL